MSDAVAIVTGAGNGLGRSIAVGLSARVRTAVLCDVDHDGLLETEELITRSSSRTTVVRKHADVSDRAQVNDLAEHYRREVSGDLAYLVNNAGIVGGSSFFADDPDHWDKTFAINWGGTYNVCRAFQPELLSSPAAYIVNVSSANGFWASSAHNTPLSAYSTSKFAIKGFTEALVVDCKRHAPNVKPVLVMLGQLDTRLAFNSRRYLELPAPADMSDAQIEALREQLVDPMRSMSVSDLREALQNTLTRARGEHVVTPDHAAGQILDAIDRGEWRIVIGDGARLLDEAVRIAPQDAYESTFLQRVVSQRDGASSNGE